MPRQYIMQMNMYTDIHNPYSIKLLERTRRKNLRHQEAYPHDQLGELPTLPPKLTYYITSSR
jgi:hypothetical protein